MIYSSSFNNHKRTHTNSARRTMTNCTHVTSVTQASRAPRDSIFATSQVPSQNLFPCVQRHPVTRISITVRAAASWSVFTEVSHDPGSCVSCRGSRNTVQLPGLFRKLPGYSSTESCSTGHRRYPMADAEPATYLNHTMPLLKYTN